MRIKICISVLIVLLTCSKIPIYSVPDFNLPDIDGNDVRLYKILHDGPVVFVVWALWNKMSIKELDALKTYSQELESMGIQMLAISQDKSRAAPQVKPFAIDHDWADSYIVVLDTANIIRELYSIEAMPTTIAIDQEGELVFTWMGYKPGDEIIIVDSLRALFKNYFFCCFYFQDDCLEFREEYVVKHITFVLIILCISLAFNQELKITDFRPPSYKNLKMLLHADINTNMGYLSYYLCLYPSYTSMSDTTEFGVGGRMSLHHDNWAICYLVSSYTDIRHYLSSFFLHGRCDIGYSKSYYYDVPITWDNCLDGDIEAGIGFGHLREGYYASLALHINRILKQENVIVNDLSKASLLEIAQLVTKRHASIIKHERYHKYLFAELQRIIEMDPACENPISAYVLFKIFDVVDYYRTGLITDVLYWSRPFGTRLSFDLLGDYITDYTYSYDDRRSFHVPLFDSIYWIPGLRIMLEHGKPLSLKNHLLLSTSYKITWYDSITRHSIVNDITYAYGIIDRIVFQPLIHIGYYHTLARDTTAQGLFAIDPEFALAYYVEDHIYFNAGIGYSIDIDLEYSDLLEISVDHGISLDFSTRWYIF